MRLPFLQGTEHLVPSLFASHLFLCFNPGEELNLKEAHTPCRSPMVFTQSHKVSFAFWVLDYQGAVLPQQETPKHEVRGHLSTKWFTKWYLTQQNIQLILPERLNKHILPLVMGTLVFQTYSNIVISKYVEPARLQIKLRAVLGTTLCS